MRRISLLLMTLAVVGCSDTEPPVVVEFRGNPISGNLTGTLRAAGGPYLATDTLYVPAGQVLTIEPGTEIRFEPSIPLYVHGKIIANGSEAAPITFTSGLKYPARGDWDGVWLINADNASSFEYCRFLYGAKYGRRYTYRTVRSQLDSTVYEYGCLMLKATSPTVRRSWFLASGFHGIHCDSASNPTVENSVFYDNAGHGIFVRWDAAPHINYNIITENDDYGVFCAEQGETPRSDLDLNYNIVWSNFSGEFNALSPISFGRIAQANGNLDSCDYRFNLRANPGYANPESWDFHLLACSFAIDAGPAGINLDGDGTRAELGVYSYTYRPGEIRRVITVNTLEAAKSPYYMSCNAFLPLGQSLTIEPGVEIRVEGLYEFRIMGRLFSSGRTDRPIRFVSAKRIPEKGDWIGLVFPNGGARSLLENTSILHARWGVRLTGQDADIVNCDISESDSVGVLCESNSSPRIQDSRFVNNSIAGILCQFNSSPEITRCVVAGGEGYGVLATESSRPLIRNSVFSDIGVAGIRLENLSNAVIVNNVFARNGYYGLNCYNNSSPDVRNNVFYNNGSIRSGGVGVFSSRSSNPVIEYNDFWGQYATPVNISGDTTAFNRGSSLFSEPVFENAGTGDWRLKAGSPLIDKGDPDVRYNDRDGSRNNIGAHGGPESGS